MAGIRKVILPQPHYERGLYLLWGGWPLIEWNIGTGLKCMVSYLSTCFKIVSMLNISLNKKLWRQDEFQEHFSVSVWLKKLN